MCLHIEPNDKCWKAKVLLENVYNDLGLFDGNTNYETEVKAKYNIVFSKLFEVYLRCWLFFSKKPLLTIYCCARAALGFSQLFVFQKTSDLKTDVHVLRGAALDHLLQTSSQFTFTYCSSLYRLKTNKFFITYCSRLVPLFCYTGLQR